MKTLEPPRPLRFGSARKLTKAADFGMTHEPNSTRRWTLGG